MTDDQTFELALDEALQLLASGVSREECLRRFPRYAAELEPLLASAEAARTGLLADQPIPRPNLAPGKRRFLDAARAQPGRPSGLLNLRRMGAVLALLVVMALGASAASANALPGEILYPLKRGLESLQLALTFDSEARARLQAEQAGRRRAEAQTVLNLNREAQVEFEGIVESVQPAELQVSGLRVLTNRAGGFQVADVVRVLAHTSLDDLVANQIILLARPTATATPIATVTPTASAPRPVDTVTLIATRQRPTETRLSPTATATSIAIRPTQTSPTDTRVAPSATRSPTETEFRTPTLTLPRSPRP